MSFLKEVVKKDYHYSLIWSTSNDPHDLYYTYGNPKPWFRYDKEQQTTGKLRCVLRRIPTGKMNDLKTELAQYDPVAGFSTIAFIVPDNTDLYAAMRSAGIFEHYSPWFVDVDDVSC